MAERVVHQLVDDLDGSDIAEGRGGRIEFTVHGVSYAIDLSTANTAKFDKALKPYIEAATRLAGRRKRAGTGRKAALDSTAVRDWAREQGYEVSARGRVPAGIVEAYTAARKSR